MSNVNSYIIIFIAWSIFGFQHSFLAQRYVKNKLKKLISNNFVDYFYPLIYFFLQCIIFAFFWKYVTSLENEVIFFDLNIFFTLMFIIFEVFGNFILLFSLLSIDINFFIGTKQLFYYFKSKILKLNLLSNHEMEKERLSTKFLYDFCRHPMYVGILIVYITHTTKISDFYIVNLICLLLYSYIGIHFEERQLSYKYGENYIKYKKNTPRLNFVYGIFLIFKRKYK